MDTPHTDPAPNVPAADPPPVEPKVVEPPAADPPAPEWDGNFDDLDTHSWWKGLPDKAREHILAAHKERTAAKSRNDYLDRMLSQDDALAASETARAEAETAAAGVRAALEKERDDFKARAETAERDLTELRIDSELAAIKAKFPDVYDDIVYEEKDGQKIPVGGAYMRLLKLLNAGISLDEAGPMARVGMTPKEPAAAPPAPPAAPPKRVPEKVPDSVALAGKGNNAAANVEILRPPLSLREALKKLQAEAAESDARDDNN